MIDKTLRNILAKHPGAVLDYTNPHTDTTLLDFPELFEELYEHYLNSGEMPIGVAKARDGDPLEWISDRVDEILFPRNQ